jgi:AcrR family transcriptional regulator
VTARIQQAIQELIIEEGVDACTFSAVAQRAGVERSTLYRRFPDRWDAIVEAWVARAGQEVVPDLGKSFADDLASVLRKLVEALESPAGPAVLRVAAELRGKSDYIRNYFGQRMAQLAPMFEAAIERRELPADVDREALFAFAAGPIYFRMFIAGQAIEDTFVRSIVDSVCRFYCLPAEA